MYQVRLNIRAGVEFQGKIYASLVELNGLVQVDLATQELTYIKRFSREKTDRSIHHIAFLHGSEAWFIPDYGEYIAIVDLETLDIKYLESPFQRIGKKITPFYYSGNVIEDRFLYLIPTKADTLLLIDMDTKKLYSYTDIASEDEVYLFGVYAEGSIYLFPHQGNNWIELNLKTGEKKEYSWNYSFGVYGDVVYHGNRIWFSPMNSDCILSMDLKTKKMTEIPLGSLYDKNNTYHQITVWGNRLYFIPFMSDKLLKYDVKNSQLIPVYLECDPAENNSNRNKFIRIYSKKHMILISKYKSFMLIYNVEQGIFTKIEISIDRDILFQVFGQNQNDGKLEDFILNNFCGRNGFYLENRLGLKKYIEINCKKSDAERSSEAFGEKIWDAVKNGK